MPWYGLTAGASSSSSIQIRGSVPSAANLPASGSSGDAYIATDTSHLWVWVGSGFIDAGPISGAGTTGSAGPAGPAPTLINGQVTALAAGSQPSATLVLVGPDTYRLDLGVPVGAKGDAGQSLLSGHGIPDPSLSAPAGSLYLDLDTYDLYKLD